MSSEETSQPDPNSTSPQLHQESKKRKLVEDIEGSESHDFKSNIPTETEAANFNRRVMKRLQKAYEKNPEVDLYRLFPVEYSGRLEQRIKDHEQKQNALAPSLIDSTPDQHVQHKSRGAIELTSARNWIHVVRWRLCTHCRLQSETSSTPTKKKIFPQGLRSCLRKAK